jgi:hypothetical protein
MYCLQFFEFAALAASDTKGRQALLELNLFYQRAHLSTTVFCGEELFA